MFRATAIAAIGTYQRYVSPHKGFCCAYRAHTGRVACSEFGRRAISRHGLRAGLALLRGRFRECAAAALALAAAKPNEGEKNEACPLASKRGRNCLEEGCAGACPWP
ncbi:membrane protein insertion efficiency factor YidD [Ramlibacter sp.]|uniref:membrane protein insertion efficiency factor YidD n=1 Tax=Ramlibacter sp. TaxID=1917967 RepID=UPI0039C94735